MRVRGLEYLLGAPRKNLDVALVGHGEAMDRDAVDDLDAGGVFVVPRDVIARARREDGDLCVRRKMLGDVARVQLGAAVDVGAVPLHDDGELHCSDGSGPSSSPESAPESDPSASES